MCFLSLFLLVDLGTLVHADVDVPRAIESESESPEGHVAAYGTEQE
jgi:hypothetical protein